MQEELRARRQRGEAIAAIPAARADALAALEAARTARPDIPRPAADEDVDDDADDGGAGRSAGADGAGDGHAGGPSTRGRLLGRRVLSLNQGRFWPGTVALYSPTATKWLYLVHWDDGVTHKWDGEPDCDGPDGQSTVQLLEETVQSCMCARCLLTGPAGCPVTTGSLPRSA